MKNLKPKYINYEPSSMSFASGFLGPRGDAGFFMNADFEKAQKIISYLLSVGKSIETVEMGLDGDWRENSMTVWQDGEFFEYDCYDNSIWAEPLIIIYYKDGSNEAYPVWFREIEVDSETLPDLKLLN